MLESDLNTTETAVDDGGAASPTEPEPAAKQPKAKKAKSETTKSETTAPKVEEETGEKKKWYILKVQVNREDPIKENLKRRIKIAGLDDYFGDILVPTEKVTEIRGDRKKIIRRKLYPGYIMIFMEINDTTWFLVRETPGIGDFTGAAGKPVPMLPHEVQRILTSEKEDPAEAPKLKVAYKIGDDVKVKEGTLKDLEGVVDAIDYTNGRVTVIINLFGRSTPVELEYWQIEQNQS